MKRNVSSSICATVSHSKAISLNRDDIDFTITLQMNPVPVMKLVEVICGLATSDATLSVTLDLAAKMGKTTTQSKDFPGFIANRILMPYINEAVFALQEV